MSNMSDDATRVLRWVYHWVSGWGALQWTELTSTGAVDAGGVDCRPNARLARKWSVAGRVAKLSPGTRGAKLRAEIAALGIYDKLDRLGVSRADAECVIRGAIVVRSGQTASYRVQSSHVDGPDDWITVLDTDNVNIAHDTMPTGKPIAGVWPSYYNWRMIDALTGETHIATADKCFDRAAWMASMGIA